MSDEKIELVKGSGNIFRDTGVPNPDIEHAKAILAAGILRILNEQKLSVRKAGKISGMNHADIARVRSADLERFSIEWLMTLFNRLEPKVEVKLTVSEREYEGAVMA